jgi:outer membrane immunogenic protein
MTSFASSRKFAAVALFLMVEVVARAHAADLPVAISSGAPVPDFSWTGCYAGVEGGDAAGSSNQVAQSGSFAGQTITGNFRMRGGLVGGTAGCNYQTGQWVFGIENDLSAINTRGTVSDIAPFNPNATSTTRETWLDTLRGRIGYSWGRTLVYGTGGLALAGAGVNVCAPAGCVNDSKTVAGLALGVGLEQSLWNSW